MSAADVSCPCCGGRTLSARAQFEICPRCGWEDDGQDEADRDEVRGGPNGDLSLTAARQYFRRDGCCSPTDVGRRGHLP